MRTTRVSRPMVMIVGRRDGRGRRIGEVEWIVSVGLELRTDVWAGEESLREVEKH